MVTADVLAKMRRVLEQVDLSTTIYDDEELLATLADARDDLQLRGLVNPATPSLSIDSLTIGYDKLDTATYGIKPEPFDLGLGIILAYTAASYLLWQHYRARVNRGEIGVTWTSGLESESTLAAGRSYEAAIQQVEDEAVRLIEIRRANVPDAGQRMQ